MKKQLIICISLVFMVLSGCNVQIAPVNNTITQINIDEDTAETNEMSEKLKQTEEITETNADIIPEPGIENGWFCGIVYEGKYYHDGMGKWIDYYYLDVGKTDFDTLKNQLENYYDFGQEVETEIQLSTANENINLKDCVGKKIFFDGNFFFEAHTVHHRRNIVFNIDEIYEISEP